MRRFRRSLALLAAFGTAAWALPLAGQSPERLEPGQPVDTTAAGEAHFLVRDGVFIARATVHALTAPARWDGTDWMKFGGAVAGVAAVSLLDESGRDAMERNRTPTNTEIEQYIEPWGAVASLGILGGMYVGGIALGDDRLRTTTVRALASSLAAAGILTPTLQKAIGRPKPRADEPAYTFEPFSGHHSMPSGHTTQAFAVASVIAAEYGHPAMQVGAYGLASAVAVSRMYRRSHFLSDVVAAALIGTAVGRAVWRFEREGEDRLRVTPELRNGQAYLVLSRSF